MEALSQPFGACPGNHDNDYGTSNSKYIQYFGDQYHYDIVNQDFMFIYLPYFTNQSTLDWMENTISTHPEYRTFICTHAYMLLNSRNFDRIENGTEIWNRIKKSMLF